MAAANVPIAARQVLSLSSLGINAVDITFRNVTMASDRGIVVRQTSPSSQIVVVDLTTGRISNNLPVNADWATLSPGGQVLAVRVGTAMQLQNIAEGRKIKGAKMPDTEQIQLMSWVDEHTVGIVTVNSVYKWNTADESSPQKIFDRHQNMAGCQVIELSASADGKWFMLVGLKPAGTTAEGCM
jgi:clathrin heavy chain